MEFHPLFTIEHSPQGFLKENGLRCEVSHGQCWYATVKFLHPNTRFWTPVLFYLSYSITIEDSGGRYWSKDPVDQRNRGGSTS